ncbi:MAG TPA: hypothetical protein VEK08_26015 [Planctomycetota bacterium]|nr:hypothetical protein [Planctomycetota bacterium]
MGLLSTDHPLALRSEKGALLKLSPAQIRNIVFGERPDRNQENEALVALGDLQSDQFETRDKALVRLRALGRAAIRPLRQALSAGDAEVAARAKALLAEMNLQNAAAVIGERVLLADETVQNGELSPAEFSLRTRWGLFRFPISSLESLTVLKPGEVQAETLAKESEPITVKAHKSQPINAAAERWELDEMQRAGAVGGRHMLGMPVLSMDTVPNPVPNAPRGQRLVATKPGDRLEDAYAPWGILLRAEAKSEIQTSAEQVSIQPSASLQLKNSDLNISFVIPGSYNAKSGESQSGGITMLGVVLENAPRLTYGMAVYDRAGRQLAEVYNLGSNEKIPAGVKTGEFLGVRSKIPIARARIFRTTDAGTRDILLDDIVFDRVVTVDRPVNSACVWLNSGERLAGQVAGAALESGILLQTDFMPAEKRTAIPFEDITRYEPARQMDEPKKDEGADKTEKMQAKGVSFGTPHGVLLQSGESFRALFIKLDEKEVHFLLAGRVRLSLPRKTLRKIDFYPPAPDPGEPAAGISVGENEKSGVDFRRKDDQKPPEKPADPKVAADEKPPEKKPKADVLQGTQELQPMPDVKILEADILTGDLTIEDDNGPWTIGLAPVKTLVFPKDQSAKKAAPRFRDWLLTLREGSCFEIVLTGITPEGITAEMAGGTVTLPSHVIDSIQKQKK